MAIEILLCFLSGDFQEMELAELYWSTSSNGAWRHSVKEIADYYGINSSAIAAKVAGIAEARIISKRCTTCGDPMIARSRSEFAQSNSNSTTCQPCTSLAQKLKAERVAQEMAAERERKNAVWLRETSVDATYDYQSMEYLDAFYAFLLLVNSEFDGNSGELAPPEAHRFSPDPNELRRITVHLFRQKILLFGKKTPLDALVVNCDKGFEYYPNRISWRFALPSGDSSFEYLFSDLNDVIESRHEHKGYSSAVSELWWHLAFSEAKRYLDLQLDNYALSIDEGDKLNDAFRYLLLNFSIPQARHLIWRVAKDTAAYAARRDVHRRQAINSIPGALIRTCDRVLANQWTINPYVLKWDEEESLITTTLFDRIFRTGVLGFKTMTGNSLSDLLKGFQQNSPIVW